MSIYFFFFSGLNNAQDVRPNQTESKKDRRTYYILGTYVYIYIPMHIIYTRAYLYILYTRDGRTQLLIGTRKFIAEHRLRRELFLFGFNCMRAIVVVVVGVGAGNRI